MSEAENIAPTLCQLLHQIATKETPEEKEKIHKNRSLVSSAFFVWHWLSHLLLQVLVTVICMLAQTWNKHLSDFQTTMCIYLLARGASWTQFDVLSHAGFTLSYMVVIQKIKDLGQESLIEIIGLIGWQAFMIIWNNLNIVFQVGKQRKALKDHFNNGTAATLIPLNGLPLNLEPPCDNWWPVINFNYEDLLPSCQQVQELKAEQLWHIEDILFDTFPELHTWFKDQIKRIQHPSHPCSPNQAASVQAQM
jgi:hypothetical protein